MWKTFAELGNFLALKTAQKSGKKWTILRLLRRQDFA